MSGKREKPTEPEIDIKTDKEIIDSVIPLLQGISTIFGSSCAVALHVEENQSLPCIAVENGHLTGTKVGMDVSGFVRDIIRDEANSGKTLVGIYYTKTPDGHALKNVTNLIRNAKGKIIGCLCISIDISIPLHEFVMNFIPVVDDNLADSLADPSASDPVGAVDDLILATLEHAMTMASGFRAVSPAERNKRIVKYLQSRGIFNIRGSTSIVAEQLGVSRYTIYNYLKAPDLDDMLKHDEEE